MAKFTLTAAHTALLLAILTGERNRVTQAEASDLVANKFIEVNTNDVNDDGALVRLTEAGTKAAEAAKTKAGTNETTVGTETPANLFSIATVVPLPGISRSGERDMKYPLRDIPLGGGLFIAVTDGQTPVELSKQIGSTIANFNKNNNVYLTTRTLKDGGEAGFGDQYKGKAGVGVYHRPLDEKKVRNTKPATAE